MPAVVYAFSIQKEKSIVPIEVKAETSIHSQSLRAYCDKFQPKEAVRFSTRKYVEQGWMIFTKKGQYTIYKLAKTGQKP